jgi:hypothetical protein
MNRFCRIFRSIFVLDVGRQHYVTGAATFAIVRLLDRPSRRQATPEGVRREEVAPVARVLHAQPVRVSVGLGEVERFPRGCRREEEVPLLKAVRFGRAVAVRGAVARRPRRWRSTPRRPSVLIRLGRPRIRHPDTIIALFGAGLGHVFRVPRSRMGDGELRVDGPLLLGVRFSIHDASTFPSERTTHVQDALSVRDLLLRHPRTDYI